MGGVKTLDLYCGWSQDNQVRRPPLSNLPIQVCGLCLLLIVICNQFSVLPPPPPAPPPTHSSLPPTVQVCDLLHLQRLWLNHNQLTILPPNFSRLSQLTELFLHHNHFKEFPSVLCHLPSLLSLWLSHNQIPSIPDDITNLSLLRRLHLDHNRIESFPVSLTSLPNLQVLYLNHNSLKSISEEVGRMKTLQHLLLQHNQISEVPRELTDLVNIERLDLGHNLLKHISKEFRSFQTVKNADNAKISTAGNPLDKAMTRMNSIDHTNTTSLRPRTMSFPLSGHCRRKSDSTPSPTPSSSGTHPCAARRHVFIHSQSEDRMV